MTALSTRDVPFLDLRPAYAELKTDIDAAVARVLESGRYLLGAELESFEEEYARLAGVRHCIGVGNGLEALALVLRATGVGPGDEVIVPSFTFIATWIAVSQVGAIPVPVEIEEHSYNLDPARVADAITPRTKAVVPVHLFGRPAAMDDIRAAAHARDIFVLEDAAQAHGASIRGRAAGELGDAAAWSFYPGKNLGAIGDGGAITTDNSDLAAKLRVLRNYGARVKYVHDTIGINSRLDDVQAAILRVKLRSLAEWNERRAVVARRYLSALGNLQIVLPSVTDGFESSWHLFVVRVPQRDRVQAALRERGIETLVHYPIPPHLQGAYASLGATRGSHPIAERVCDEVLSLPMGPHLDSASQERVIEALTDVLA